MFSLVFTGYEEKEKMNQQVSNPEDRYKNGDKSKIKSRKTPRKRNV
jgi:hypothetical protein